MDRFERLLGKKHERSAAEEPSAGKNPEQSPAPDPRPGEITAQEPAYGLKFVFDSGEFRMFTSLPIQIGRSEENQLVIQDDSVSAQHAVVLFDDRVKEICIVDLDSLNGVTVNDLPTRKNVLKDGSRIGLGRVHLVYRDTGYIHPA